MGTWVFLGYLLCTGTAVDGCNVRNHTHFTIQTGLTQAACETLVREAKAIPNSPGGFCYQERTS